MATLEEVLRHGNVAGGHLPRFGGAGQANFLFCPHLCPSCRHLKISDTNIPFGCGADTSAAAYKLDWQNLMEQSSCQAYSPHRVEQTSRPSRVVEEESSGSDFNPEDWVDVEEAREREARIDKYRDEFRQVAEQYEQYYREHPEERPTTGPYAKPAPAFSGIKNVRYGVTALLALVGGVFGLHRFYNGKGGTGLLYLCTFGLAGFGVVYDLLMIATGRFTHKDGTPVRNE